MAWPRLSISIPKGPIPIPTASHASLRLLIHLPPGPPSASSFTAPPQHHARGDSRTNRTDRTRLSAPWLGHNTMYDPCHVALACASPITELPVHDPGKRPLAFLDDRGDGQFFHVSPSRS